METSQSWLKGAGGGKAVKAGEKAGAAEAETKSCWQIQSSAGEILLSSKLKIIFTQTKKTKIGLRNKSRLTHEEIFRNASVNMLH